jgi:outer membrane murein-binding lipoprotein Lpp
VKKLLTAVVLMAGALLTGCSSSATAPQTSSAPPKMSVQESCNFLNTDTFVPTGSAKEQAAQIGQHYQEVADKVAPEVGAPIQQMANIMKQVSESPTGTKTDQQTAQLTEQINKIGQYCK